MFPIGAWIWLGLIAITIFALCSYKLMPKIGDRVINRANDIKHTILDDKERENNE